MAEIDALSWQDFEKYVADLCRRDDCTQVVVSGKSGDLGADVVGYLADGRKLVVQVKKYAPERSVSSQDMQKFVGTARPEHGADVALFVTTCRTFTGFLRGCPGLQAGEESDPCGAGQGRSNRRQGDWLPPPTAVRATSSM